MEKFWFPHLQSYIDETAAGKVWVLRKKAVACPKGGDIRTCHIPLTGPDSIIDTPWADSPISSLSTRLKRGSSMPLDRVWRAWQDSNLQPSA